MVVADGVFFADRGFPAVVRAGSRSSTQGCRYRFGASGHGLQNLEGVALGLTDGSCGPYSGQPFGLCARRLSVLCWGWPRDVAFYRGRILVGAIKLTGLYVVSPADVVRVCAALRGQGRGNFVRPSKDQCWSSCRK